MIATLGTLAVIGGAVALVATRGGSAPAVRGDASVAHITADAALLVAAVVPTVTAIRVVVVPSLIEITERRSRRESDLG